MFDHIENRIERLYRREGVTSPSDVTLYLWDCEVRVLVVHRPGITDAARVRDQHVIFVDSHLALPQRRVEIAHEIGHAVLHAGRHDRLSNYEQDRQDLEADHFALHALMPSYLLAASCQRGPWDQGACVEYVADLYCVPVPFAARRLEQWCARRSPVNRVAESAPEYDYVTVDAMDRRVEYLMRDGKVVGKRKRGAQ